MLFSKSNFHLNHWNWPLKSKQWAPWTILDREKRFLSLNSFFKDFLLACEIIISELSCINSGLIKLIHQITKDTSSMNLNWWLLDEIQGCWFQWQKMYITPPSWSVTVMSNHIHFLMLLLSISCTEIFLYLPLIPERDQPYLGIKFENKCSKTTADIAPENVRKMKIWKDQRWKNRSIMWAVTRKEKKKSEKSQEIKINRSCFEDSIGYGVQIGEGNKDDSRVLFKWWRK